MQIIIFILRAIFTMALLGWFAGRIIGEEGRAVCKAWANVH